MRVLNSIFCRAGTNGGPFCSSTPGLGNCSGTLPKAPEKTEFDVVLKEVPKDSMSHANRKPPKGPIEKKLC